MSYQVEILASDVGHKNGSIKVTSGFLLDYFDITRDTLSKWAERGCPKLAHGHWDLIAVLKWRGGLAAVDGVEEDESGASASLRKIKADAYLKEQQGAIAAIELQKLQGSVIEIEEVEDLIGSVIMNTKGLLLALPSKAAPKLLGLSALDDLTEIMLEHKGDIIKARAEKDVAAIIERVVGEFCEAESIMEINEVLALLIHEALEELASMRIGAEGIESEVAEDPAEDAGAMETDRTD